MQPLAVDVREAARLTSLSTFTIRRYIRRGHLRAIRVGRRLIVPLEVLEGLVRDGPSTPSSGNSQPAKPLSSRNKAGPNGTPEQDSATPV